MFFVRPELCVKLNLSAPLSMEEIRSTIRDVGRGDKSPQKLLLPAVAARRADLPMCGIT